MEITGEMIGYLLGILTIIGIAFKPVKNYIGLGATVRESKKAIKDIMGFINNLKDDKEKDVKELNEKIDKGNKELNEKMDRLFEKSDTKQEKLKDHMNAIKDELVKQMHDNNVLILNAITNNKKDS